MRRSNFGKLSLLSIVYFTATLIYKHGHCSKSYRKDETPHYYVKALTREIEQTRLLLESFDTDSGLGPDSAIDFQNENLVRNRLLSSGPQPYHRYVLPWSSYSSQFITQNDTTLQPVISSCRAFVKAFSEASAAFIQCVVENSKPSPLCMSCSSSYISSSAVYLMIMNDSIVEQAGMTCADFVTNYNHLHIVSGVYQTIKNIWHRCYCDNCFESYSENDPLNTLIPRNSTIEFITQFHLTIQCFHNHSDGDVIPFLSNITLNYTVCTGCSKQYLQLSDLFIQLETKNGRQVCLDLVDYMNHTRLLWSSGFDCIKRSVDPGLVVLVSSFLAVITGVFYVTSMIHETKLQKKLFRQTRLSAPVSVVEVTSTAVEEN